MFLVDNQHIITMRKHLGDDASSIITNNNFLPMFRNRQIRFPKEFKLSVNIAKKKRNPAHYFAKIWAKDNIERSLNWLGGMLNRAKAKLAEARHQAELFKRKRQLTDNYNPVGVNQLRSLYGNFGNLR